MQQPDTRHQSQLYSINQETVLLHGCFYHAMLHSEKKLSKENAVRMIVGQAATGPHRTKQSTKR